MSRRERIHHYLDRWASLEYGVDHYEIAMLKSRGAENEFLNLMKILEEYENRLEYGDAKGEIESV